MNGANIVIEGFDIIYVGGVLITMSKKKKVAIVVQVNREDLEAFLDYVAKWKAEEI